MASRERNWAQVVAATIDAQKKAANNIGVILTSMLNNPDPEAVRFELESLVVFLAGFQAMLIGLQHSVESMARQVRETAIEQTKRAEGS